ncbi:MAG: tryptophan-rich sensory protein [Methanothrix sp.]|nr:tryptophan-rich sensory protein [Methanothrix sp.]
MKSITAKEAGQIIVCIGVCEAAGILGSIFTASSVATWYQTLNKPWFNPPGFVFSAVWIALYAMMGLSLFLIWHDGQGSQNYRAALATFAAQLLVNVLWSYAFFGLQSPLTGILVIVLLWLLILQTFVTFWSIRREAALLLIPYILWVSFAGFLNYTVWRLNP